MSQLNTDIFRLINDWGKQLDFLNPIVVFIAEYTIYFLALAMLFYWFTGIKRYRMMVIQAGLAFVLAEVIGKLLGKLHEHHQPFAELPDVSKLIDHAINNSFPSDHTILFFSICTSFWLVRKRNGWFWLVLATCVAISRVWVGVHYPVDILVGAIVGIISALICYWFIPDLRFIKRLLASYEKLEQRILPRRQKSRR
ncbi:undecaprenyl-diphosphatase [Paenibacillus sp. N1-5-1-14]|uniref:undecaprenyl-diphosphatase n=1 Tax=Paenibacillus radicibacter TaxID=2972488 RepID=UPI00215922A2|nr:undecaprenyl-diphosphatase [Paenibacillus radicibacter]MCR8645448.1 undecaprenyl-diphosphatase [Paenibacillus radicibacter]